ncbi:MAG: hypothetical protein ACK4UV_11585, partial [Ignavibacterium sp.]
MEKLWSPWRSKYIESFKSDEDKSKCIFCQMTDLNADDKDNLLVHQAYVESINLQLDLKRLQTALEKTNNQEIVLKKT